MSGVYDPEVVGLMGAALDAAWARFSPRPKDVDLARLLMASAILERVDAGVSTMDSLVEAASRALHAALSSPLLQTALHRTTQFESSRTSAVKLPATNYGTSPNFPFQVQVAEPMIDQTWPFEVSSQPRRIKWEPAKDRYTFGLMPQD
jgi:hypothetical protein